VKEEIKKIGMSEEDASNRLKQREGLKVVASR